MPLLPVLMLPVLMLVMRLYIMLSETVALDLEQHNHIDQELKLLLLYLDPEHQVIYLGHEHLDLALESQDLVLKRQDPTLYLALIYIWICIWMDLAHELDHERQELIHDHPDRSDAP